MGCSGQKGPIVELPKSLTIHGHILETQTRSLMAICDYAKEKHTVNKINTLKQENKTV